jgi:hypothetical protein
MTGRRGLGVRSAGAPAELIEAPAIPRSSLLLSGPVVAVDLATDSVTSRLVRRRLAAARMNLCANDMRT